MTIRVALVDDQELLRTGLAMVVDASGDMQVVAQAGDGHAAVATLSRTPADVVLMDIQMPHMDGIEATRRLVARSPQLKVIALTTFDVDEYVFAVLRAGASGFLLKDASAEEVLAAIRTVRSGDAVIAPSTTRRLLDQLAAVRRTPDDSPQLKRLTEREREVLLEIAGGFSNAEIAERLYLSEATVKTHIGNLLTKLEVRDRVQAVIFAYDHGLVQPR
ncbi:MAG: response regulator [Propionibacteriales bacterium]|nr:response regulator [Propionibacteriales bacterium]